MKYLYSVFKGFASFKPSTLIFLILLVALAAILYFAGKQKKWDTKTLVIGSLCVAASFVLSYIKFVRFPQGGSITPASMLPLMVFAYIFGPGPGIIAGIVYGLLDLVQDPYVVHPVQLLLDYIFAFGAMGLAGFFKNNLTLGIIFSGFSRFVFNFISGMVFFGSFAPKGTPVWLYSLGYNGLIVGPDILICLIIALIPQVSNLFKNLKKQYQVKGV